MHAAWTAGLALFPDTPHYREKELTKFFEYMAAGLPIICSDFPVWRELVERHRLGLCVDPEDHRGRRRRHPLARRAPRGSAAPWANAVVGWSKSGSTGDSQMRILNDLYRRMLAYLRAAEPSSLPSNALSMSMPSLLV